MKKEILEVLKAILEDLDDDIEKEWDYSADLVIAHQDKIDDQKGLVDGIKKVIKTLDEDIGLHHEECIKPLEDLVQKIKLSRIRYVYQTINEHKLICELKESGVKQRFLSRIGSIIQNCAMQLDSEGYPINSSDIPDWVEEYLSLRLVLHSSAATALASIEKGKVRTYTRALKLLAVKYRRMRRSKNGRYQKSKSKYETALENLGLRQRPSVQGYEVLCRGNPKNPLTSYAIFFTYSEEKGIVEVHEAGRIHHNKKK